MWQLWAESITSNMPLPACATFLRCWEGSGWGRMGVLAPGEHWQSCGHRHPQLARSSPRHSPARAQAHLCASCTFWVRALGCT